MAVAAVAASSSSRASTSSSSGLSRTRSRCDLPPSRELCPPRHRHERAALLAGDARCGAGFGGDLPSAARHGRRGGRREGEPQRDGPRDDHRPDLEGLDQLASAERRATCPEPFHSPNASPIPASRRARPGACASIMRSAASTDRRTRPGADRRSPSGEADGAFWRRGAARAALEGAGGANQAGRRAAVGSER